MINDFGNWCVHQHDVVCNQKYAGTLPYSMHLKWVDAQSQKFKYLLTFEEWVLADLAKWGHDLIEDARVTYNDIAARGGEKVAEVVYLCTENKGRNRAERHNDDYYKGLQSNEVAIFVKLCDLIANVTFSLLENSSMYGKYRAEYPKIAGLLYTARFKPMFDYLEKLLNIN